MRNDLKKKRKSFKIGKQITYNKKPINCLKVLKKYETKNRKINEKLKINERNN